MWSSIIKDKILDQNPFGIMATSSASKLKLVVETQSRCSPLKYEEVRILVKIEKKSKENQVHLKKKRLTLEIYAGKSHRLYTRLAQ